MYSAVAASAFQGLIFVSRFLENYFNIKFNLLTIGRTENLDVHKTPIKKCQLSKLNSKGCKMFVALLAFKIQPRQRYNAPLTTRTHCVRPSQNNVKEITQSLAFVLVFGVNVT